MDIELVIWMTLFVGGYALVVAWLMRIALRRRDE